MLDSEFQEFLEEIDRDGRGWRLDSALELRLADKNPHLIGHAAVFNQRSQELFGFYEVLSPGAFQKALGKSDVRFLINHEGLPLARSTSGTLSLSEDRRGLAFDADLDPKDADVQRLLPKIQRGDLNQMSFGFSVLREGQTWTNDDKVMIRTIHEINQLYDVSVVTFPAYSQTDVSARALEIRAFIKQVAPSVSPDFSARMKEHKEFLACRAPVPDPYSLKEIIKRHPITKFGG